MPEQERIEGFVRENAEDEDVPDIVDGEILSEEPADVVEGEIVAESPESEDEGEAVGTEQAETFDELTDLLQQLEEVQKTADEYLDDLRRERAAFQNYKKRQENERNELRQLAISGLVVQILPILDDFERALESVPEEHADKPWIEGIKLIQRKLQTTMEAAGVQAIETEPGQPFDPFIHEAVTYEEAEDHEEGEIIAVVYKGYKLNERTLRPAMVRVAK